MNSPMRTHDPHSPLAGFFWAHMGWLMVKLDDMSRRPLIERYAKDIIRDPYYAWLDRRSNWIKVALLSWLAFFAAGFAVIALSGGSLAEATQFGLSLLGLGRGAADRRGLAHHLVGQFGDPCLGLPQLQHARRQPQQRADRACSSSGEGWHNNHHADSRSARHGHKWWEIDLTWLAIRLLMLLGLAKNVALPSPILAAKFNSAGPRLAPRRCRGRQRRFAGAEPAAGPFGKTRRRPRRSNGPPIGVRPIDAPPNSRDSPAIAPFT